MDVDGAHFRKQLLAVLKNISDATFITFDLEMSGITTRPKHSSGYRTHDVGKPTLQQQYEEMKSAAETFQILQMGITCVEEDRERGEPSPSCSFSVVSCRRRAVPRFRPLLGSTHRGVRLTFFSDFPVLWQWYPV